jgi:hypothetical protein
MKKQKKEIAMTNDWENHYFMQIMKNDFPLAYTAVKKGLAIGLIEFKNNLFNFKCVAGCVGLIFSEAGYTEYKQIARFIFINEKKLAPNTLKNCTKNTPPKEWERIKQVIFPNNPKTTPK